MQFETFIQATNVRMCMVIENTESIALRIYAEDADLVHAGHLGHRQHNNNSQV